MENIIEELKNYGSVCISNNKKLFSNHKLYAICTFVTNGDNFVAFKYGRELKKNVSMLIESDNIKLEIHEMPENFNSSLIFSIFYNHCLDFDDCIWMNITNLPHVQSYYIHFSNSNDEIIQNSKSCINLCLIENPYDSRNFEHFYHTVKNIDNYQVTRIFYN
jgi:hypothetical protein